MCKKRAVSKREPVKRRDNLAGPVILLDCTDLYYCSTQLHHNPTRREPTQETLAGPHVRNGLEPRSQARRS